MWVLQIVRTNCLIFLDSCVTLGQKNKCQQALIIQLKNTATNLDLVQNAEPTCTEIVILYNHQCWVNQILWLAVKWRLHKSHTLLSFRFTRGKYKIKLHYI